MNAIGFFLFKMKIFNPIEWKYIENLIFDFEANDKEQFNAICNAGIIYKINIFIFKSNSNKI